jgi:hypothetical protein
MIQYRLIIFVIINIAFARCNTYVVRRVMRISSLLGLMIQLINVKIWLFSLTMMKADSETL